MSITTVITICTRRAWPNLHKHVSRYFRKHLRLINLLCSGSCSIRNQINRWNADAIGFVSFIYFRLKKYTDVFNWIFKESDIGIILELVIVQSKFVTCYAFDDFVGRMKLSETGVVRDGYEKIFMCVETNGEVVLIFNKVGKVLTIRFSRWYCHGEMHLLVT